MALEGSYDVIIIGGGPAGSSMALNLEMFGVSALVLEKEKFPRPHVGESLVPFCYDLFEELGVLSKMESSMVRKPGVRFVNVDGTYSTTYCFKNLLEGPNHLSFHVLRSRFDKILLDTAQERGVAVREECRVTSLNLEDELPRVLAVNKDGVKEEFSARFIIDATGQDTFLGSKLKLKTKHPDLDRIAFLSHWSDFKTNGGINEGLLQLVYLDDAKKGWLGIQPVDKNRLSVGLVVDFAYARKRKQELNSPNWKEEFYLSELKQTAYTKEILKDASMIQELLVVGNYSYRISQKFGSNFAMVGDAAGFIDPIFATGIYLAMNSSRVTAPAVAKIVKGNSDGVSELAEAYQHYEGAVDMLEKFIRNFYNPDFINLAELGNKMQTKDESHVKHQIAFSIVHFLMGGDFFNEYKRYSDFVDFLQQPKQLERYMHLVMNQEKYKESSCGLSSNQVFPE